MLSELPADGSLEWQSGYDLILVLPESLKEVELVAETWSYTIAARDWRLEWQIVALAVVGLAVWLAFYFRCQKRREEGMTPYRPQSDWQLQEDNP